MKRCVLYDSDKKDQIPFYKFIHSGYYFSIPGLFFGVMGQLNAVFGKNRYQ